MSEYELRGGNLYTPSFTGPYNFLSNFFRTPMPIVYEGKEYATAEHAYQARKFNSNDLREHIRCIPSPGGAKGAAHSGSFLSLVREDWCDIKEAIMLDLVRIKFSQPEMAAMLKATDGVSLIEHNKHGDDYWGVFEGRGANKLGKILSLVRSELLAHDNPISTKQVIVIRKDLNMRKGKIAAQAAHASSKVFFDRAKQVSEDSFLIEGLSKAEVSWLKGSFTKPVCYVNSEVELVELYEKALSLGLPCSIITDIGKTEFHGVPTKTAVAIGPAEVAEVDKVTLGLPLL